MTKQIHSHCIAKLLLALPLLVALLGVQAQAAEEPMHHVSSETCKLCHKEIYKQWKGSMHGNSNALTDPIHGTFYKKVVGDPTQEGVKMKNGKYPVCLNCHAPNAARDGKTKLDAMPAYHEGVNCVACHTLSNFKGVKTADGKLRLGIKAYELKDSIQAPAGAGSALDKMKAASDDLFGGALAGDGDQKPNPHLGEPVELDGKQIPALSMEQNGQQMKTSDACMGCHDQRPNGKGVPLCATGDEYVASGSKVDCLACHMPIANGMADHSMGGGHDPAMLKRSVLMTLDAKAEGDAIKAAVSLQNKLPHNLPTGAPFRNIFLKLTAYDASGEVVWQNAKGHPAKEDPQAYLWNMLQDDEGKFALPPVATKLGPDTRLKPFETRVLNYAIPAQGVALVRAELYYNLLWPGLVKKFTHLPTELTDPVKMAATEVKF
ncbi:cytochrome c family protein [Magnetovirga frankeli]|uniref:cytochrome c family protein n=1 Tax=Magnetovirga frankeli TaxID=947516 RepID=UPI0012936A6C|nr:cytochrome c family protein [gamma proteobacterium SS-5]